MKAPPPVEIVQRCLALPVAAACERQPPGMRVEIDGICATSALNRCPTSMDFSSKRFKQGKIQKRKTKCSAGHCTIQNITKQVCKCSRTFVARETLASQKAATICAPKRASSKLL